MPRWEGGEYLARIDQLIRERDEARAEAARYREALERIANANWPPPRYYTIADLARAALTEETE